MQQFFDVINAINGVMLGVPMLLALLLVGLIFTVWTRFCQYRSLTHGVGLLTGRWTGSQGEGAISHFQALSAALSATVGLGNIAGVAIAVELGGPGAVFWMWIIGLVGMALKTTEVTLSMLYRDTSDPDNPHGGTMWVAKRALPALSGHLKTAGPIERCRRSVSWCLQSHSATRTNGIQRIPSRRLELFLQYVNRLLAY